MKLYVSMALGAAVGIAHNAGWGAVMWTGVVILTVVGLVLSGVWLALAWMGATMGGRVSE
jgi:hypothetical protein